MKNVISRKNLPTNMGFGRYIAVYLLMQHLGSPDWLYGVMGTLAVIIIIIDTKHLMANEEVDIFQKKPRNPNGTEI
jgi:hypothetical protein